MANPYAAGEPRDIQLTAAIRERGVRVSLHELEGIVDINEAGGRTPRESVALGVICAKISDGLFIQ